MLGLFTDSVQGDRFHDTAPAVGTASAGEVAAPPPIPAQSDLFPPLMDARQRAGKIREGRRVQHLNAGIVLTVKRRYGTGTACLCGIAWIIEPQPKMVHLDWPRRRIRADAGKRVVECQWCGSLPGATTKVSILKRPIKVPWPFPRESVSISP
jgi:hypothetical protein